MSATITARSRVLTALVVGFCLCLGGLSGPAAAVDLGTMTGQVSDAAHEPLSDAGVSLFRWVDHGGGASSFDYLGTKVTGTDGTYSWSGLAAGDYYARVSRDGYATAYSDGATTDPLTATHAGVFHLAAGASWPEDFTLAALHSELGTVSGTVTDEDGAPVDALRVEAFPVGATTSVNLTYTVGGSFTLHVPAGDYSLHFHDVANRFPDDELPGPLAVTVGETTSAPPFTLASPQAVTATGTVTDAGGTALQGADVTLWRVLGSGHRAGRAYIGEAVTDGSGAYELTGLGAGLQYTVEASKDGYRARFLGDVTDGSAALTITAAEANILDTIHLPVANQVAGRVTGAGGAGPLADVRVSLLRWTPGDAGPSFLKTSDYDVTAPDGSFSIAGVAPGSYTLSFEPPEDSVFDIGYLNGRSLPPGPPPSAGTFDVATEASDVAGQDVVLSRRLHGTGHVAAADGPLADTTVEAYRWDEVARAWDLYDQTTTDASGDYHLRLPHNATVTVSAAKNRFARQFLGGAPTLSAAPSAGDHIDTLGSDVTLGAFTLARRSTALGSKAGQDLPFCYAHDLQLWSDSSSSAVPLPAAFPVRFFGTAYDELFVNDNGNITFGGDNTTFTPEDLTTTGLPVIAPFWADMDGRGNDVAASYGFSPDGTRFCAVWTDMGYYDRHADRLNTVQVLLTSADGAVDRSPGDFDITFDYDRVDWDAGDFDGGQGGLAAATGRSAAVGFSAGTGAPRTSFQLDGSLVPGSLVDGGPNALVEGSAASTTPGRYVFQVRNDGSQATAGSLSGSVTDQFGSPVDGATATLLRSDTRGGTYTPAAGGAPVTTDATGTFSWDVV